MAALCFSEAHLGRAIGLDVPALARLCRAGDLEDVERCAGRLAPDALRHVLATLPDERRRALERHLERFGNKPRGSVTGQRAERFWAALRLRRLFRR